MRLHVEKERRNHRDELLPRHIARFVGVNEPLVKRLEERVLAEQRTRAVNLPAHFARVPWHHFRSAALKVTLAYRPAFHFDGAFEMEGRAQRVAGLVALRAHLVDTERDRELRLQRRLERIPLSLWYNVLRLVVCVKVRVVKHQLLLVPVVPSLALLPAAALASSFLATAVLSLELA